ncbi:MAG: SHOCT domain-containing protein [Actinomycetes bacterium]
MRGQLGPVGPSREGQDAQEGTVEERLRRLDQLRRSGLVSPEEYEQQRRRILDSL